MPDMNYTPKTVRVLTAEGFYEDIVTECHETEWDVCCMCKNFNCCQIKGKNRRGLIPNILNEIKKLNIKFFMELKVFNKSHGKRTL